MAEKEMDNVEGAQAFPMQEHSCEICGMSGLTDDEMRDHTRTCHVEGNAQCPFCGLGGRAPAELLLHVNQAHLDYLTPENELMSFIDDQSPSADGDSDSMSECRGLSPSITDLPGINGHKPSSFATASMNGSSLNAGNVNNHFGAVSTNLINHRGAGNQTQLTNGSINHSINNINHHNNSNCNRNLNHVTTKIEISHVDSDYSGGGGMATTSTVTKNNDIKVCDMNGSCSKDPQHPTSNGSLDNPKGGQGSPLRSQLGLKLKSHKPANTKPSPLQCLLCPYVSDHASVLEEHMNRSHFDPMSPSLNGVGGAGGTSTNHGDTLNILACPICCRIFDSGSDLELHVNIEHRDILSPAKVDHSSTSTGDAAAAATNQGQMGFGICPVCNISFSNMRTHEMELHIEGHFAKSPVFKTVEPNLEKQAQKLREQREFEMLRAQYGMDDQGNFREQSATAMQRAVYAGEMSVADYYERQVGLRAAESHGIDDGTSCTRSIAPRVMSLSSSSPGVMKSYVCSAVDHYASSYGDKGWGCGYRNLQMLLSSLLQNTTYNEAIYSAWGTQGPSRTAMPSISRLQKMCEAAWAQGFDVQGSEQLGCKLYNTRKWIGATEVVTVLSWLRINSYLVDFHRPTTLDGRHPELFNWVLKYFEESRDFVSPLYLQHQGHSRTIIGIEQRSSGLSLLILDPSHAPREVAALGSSQDTLRLIRRGSAAMRAPQYQIVAVKGLIETEEQYQASKVLRSLRIPPDR